MMLLYFVYFLCYQIAYEIIFQTINSVTWTDWQEVIRTIHTCMPLCQSMYHMLIECLKQNTRVLLYAVINMIS